MVCQLGIKEMNSTAATVMATQLKAIEKIGKVYGDNAPTNIDISGSLASTRDADLYDEIEEALENPLGTSPGESGASQSNGGEV